MVLFIIGLWWFSTEILCGQGQGYLLRILYTRDVRKKAEASECCNNSILTTEPAFAVARKLYCSDFKRSHFSHEQACTGFHIKAPSPLSILRTAQLPPPPTPKHKVCRSIIANPLLNLWLWLFGPIYSPFAIKIWYKMFLFYIEKYLCFSAWYVQFWVASEVDWNWLLWQGNSHS